MKLSIRPEPWSASTAHLIRTRAMQALAREPKKQTVTFKFSGYYVTVKR